MADLFWSQIPSPPVYQSLPKFKIGHQILHQINCKLEDQIHITSNSASLIFLNLRKAAQRHTHY
jgi:hypothetical protein